MSCCLDEVPGVQLALCFLNLKPMLYEVVEGTVRRCAWSAVLVEKYGWMGETGELTCLGTRHAGHRQSPSRGIQAFGPNPRTV